MRGTHGEVKRSEANVPGLGGGVLISSTQVLEGLSGAERAMRAVVATPARSRLANARSNGGRGRDSGQEGQQSKGAPGLEHNLIIIEAGLVEIGLT